MSYSNAMVGHLWAQREKPRARSSNGNMSFEGPTLYSYSTPIGRFIDVGKVTAILVTSRRYSITTSGRHMPALWRGIDYSTRDVFEVPHLSPYDAQHKENLAHLVTQYRAWTERAKRAVLHSWRAPNSEEALAKELEALAVKARRYAELFKLRRYLPKFDPAGEARAVFEARREREARYSTPEAIAKRAKAAAAREALQRRHDELERAESEERIAAWRNGEPVRLRHGERIGGSFGEPGTALLRVRGDKLETSLDATVPLDHAIRVFRFVKLCRERGEAWQRNGRSLRVGHFQVDRVEANGDFRAGCHFIAWAETEAAALQAGVADITPEDTRDVPVAA